MFITLIAAAALGVFIGLFSGLLGVGGGTVMVPMFRLVFGLSAFASTGTSLFTVIPTSLSGVISHLRRKTCIPKLGLVLGIGGACTSPLGVLLANNSPSWAVMCATALAIGYSAYNMLKKVRELPKDGSRVDLKAAGSAAASGSFAINAANDLITSATVPNALEVPTITTKQLVAGFVIGLIAGIASGYVGLGGGFLMVPLMLVWLNIPMKQTAGTSLLAVMLLAIPGAVTQGVLGNIDYLVGIATAVGTIPGAYLGARLVSRVPERQLRIAFSVFLGIGAVLLVVKEVSLFV